MSSTLSRFSDDDFAPFADAVGISTSQYRKLAETAENGLLTLEPALEMSVVQAELPNCKDIDFNIKIFRIKGQACFTPGKNWILTVDFQVFAFGIELDRVKYTFSSAQTSVTYNYNLLFGKLELTVGVRSPRVCLFTSGKVSGFGKSKSWDETLFCFA